MHAIPAYPPDNLVFQRRVHPQAVHLGHQQQRVLLIVRVLQPVCERVDQQQPHRPPVQHHAVVSAPREAPRGHAAVRVLPHDLPRTHPRFRRAPRSSDRTRPATPDPKKPRQNHRSATRQTRLSAPARGPRSQSPRGCTAMLISLTESRVM